MSASFCQERLRGASTAGDGFVATYRVLVTTGAATLVVVGVDKTTGDSSATALEVPEYRPEATVPIRNAPNNPAAIKILVFISTSWKDGIALVIGIGRVTVV
jgi:hypothetical protein